MSSRADARIKLNRRDQIVDSAMRHLYQMGYNRFSFAYVSKDCGIAKASIHYHFPSKDSLVIAAIEKYTNERRKFLVALRDNQELNAVEKFDKLFDYAYDHIIAMNYVGCLAGNLGLEISETNQNIRSLINDFMSYKEKILSDIIEAGKKSGHFKKKVDSTQVAQSIMASLEGGIVISKISKSPDMLAAALHVCRSIVRNDLLI